MQICAQNITAYMNYLRANGYTITLHGKFVNKEFCEYNCHYNPYCHYIKSYYEKWNHCICQQEKVREKCTCAPFFGTCYCGVGEYIYPVHINDAVWGFISVSGFRNEESEKKAELFAEKNNISPQEIKDLINKHLSENIPEKSTVDAVIDPLVFMLEKYLENNCENITDDKKLYHNMVRYINENYHSKITMAELAAKFNYSVSSLSHLFAKNAEKSLPRYVEELRLNEAKWHLRNGKLSVTEIAHFLGYGSGQYFSTAFKKKYGVTPYEYRKSENIK